MNQLPVIPDNAPFSAAQRIWLNGFLAGLFAQSSSGPNPATGAASEKAATPLLVIFGSQTGTAEGLARRLASEAS
jgi:sulfite reductase (NADPH) flavoprotein alpha-component